MIQLKQLNYLPYQWLFITSDKRQTALVAGQNSGKTVAGLAVCLYMHMTKKAKDVYTKTGRFVKKGKSNGWVIFPTFDMASLLFITPFLLMLRDAKIGYKYNNHMITTKYGTIRIFSMAYPLRFVGSNLTWAYLDEADNGNFKKLMMAWKKLLGRMRGCDNPQIFVTGTPLGYNLLYTVFNLPHPNKKLVRASTLDNPYADKLYIQSLYDSYDKNMLLAYLNGQFCNLFKGLAYHAFDRRINVIKLYTPVGKLLIVGIDFNIDFFSMTISLWIHLTKTLYTFHLIQKPNFHTALAVDLLLYIYADYKLYITPDLTGGQRKTSASHTDMQILQAGLTNLGKFQILNKLNAKQNPHHKDRLNCVNNALLKQKSVITLNCKILISDLLRVPVNPDGTIDKSNLKSGLNHMADAYGYTVINVLPIVQRKGSRLITSNTGMRN